MAVKVKVQVVDGDNVLWDEWTYIVQEHTPILPDAIDDDAATMSQVSRAIGDVVESRMWHQFRAEKINE